MAPRLKCPGGVLRGIYKIPLKLCSRNNPTETRQEPSCVDVRKRSEGLRQLLIISITSQNHDVAGWLDLRLHNYNNQITQLIQQQQTAHSANKCRTSSPRGERVGEIAEFEPGNSDKKQKKHTALCHSGSRNKNQRAKQNHLNYRNRNRKQGIKDQPS